MLSLKDCHHISQIVPTKYEKPDTITKIKIIYINDTIQKLAYIKSPKVKDSIFIHDTIKYHTLDYSPCNYIRVYKDSSTDSNVTIFYNDTIQGRLLSTELKYRLKVPKTIEITKIITNKTNDKYSIYTGMELGGNKTSFSISPFVSLNTRKNTYYYRYDILNKTHNIGIGIKILRR